MNIDRLSPEQRKAIEQEFKQLSILEGRVREIQKSLIVQGENGIWNCDDYMLGVYNGIELAVSTMQGRTPKFRSLVDKPSDSPDSVMEKSSKDFIPVSEQEGLTLDGFPIGPTVPMPDIKYPEGE